MPKYEVEYMVTEIYTAIVEADSFEDVSDKFWNEFDEHELQFERTVSEEINAITELTELEEE